VRELAHLVERLITTRMQSVLDATAIREALDGEAW
jgi:hypothetical protein